MLRKAIIAIAGCALIAGLASSGGAAVPTPPIANYKAVPPFVSQTVVPNVMILLDTSGSMNNSFDGTVFNAATDVEYGPFDQTECYNYQASANGGTAFVPNPGANAATPPTSCPAGYPWSGNLLNYAVIRRADVDTWALIGGVCNIARNADLSCNQIHLLYNYLSARTVVQRVSVANATNLMPAGLIPTGVGIATRTRLPAPPATSISTS